MKKLFLLLFLVSGCHFGVDRQYSEPTHTVYYETETVEYVHIEVEDPDYYEFYNSFGEWCYGDRDPHAPSCHEEWCYDPIDDWWYEWDFVCQPHPHYYY